MAVYATTFGDYTYVTVEGRVDGDKYGFTADFQVNATPEEVVKLLGWEVIG